MRLEVGKKYSFRNADGYVEILYIIPEGYHAKYPCIGIDYNSDGDIEDRIDYTLNGNFWVDGDAHNKDLVAEYVEPSNITLHRYTVERYDGELLQSQWTSITFSDWADVRGPFDTYKLLHTESKALELHVGGHA
jgi:hypothetical protein